MAVDPTNMLVRLISDLRVENTAAHNDILATVRAQNSRIKKLELWRAKLLGICAAISAGIAAAITIWGR